MQNEPTIDNDDIREIVKEKYGQAALRVLSNQKASCCSSRPTSATCCSGNEADPITGDLYSVMQASEIPEAAMLASLGCGNPTALAQLKEGEIVLDLGSGGGIDVLLSAKRVGPTGFAYGLDMTDEMLSLAEENKQAAAIQNVEFLKGHIESIPLPDSSVDVIISNCVINLSGDKPKVIGEAFRVLKPGGRFAVSDIVVESELPEPVRKDMEAYVGCVAGALEREKYLELLNDAGFEQASIEPTRIYRIADIESSWAPKGVGQLTPEEKAELDGKIFSAFIRAQKPR
jgi:SAM-dependent methyltransferase